MGFGLVPVALGPGAVEKPVEQNARARALVAIDHQACFIAQRKGHRPARIKASKARIIRAMHDPLHAPPSLDQFQPFAQERPVVCLGLVIEEMNGREIAFAALGRSQTAETAHRDDAHLMSGRHQGARDKIKPRAMAADDGEVRHAQGLAEQGHLDCGARRDMVGERVNAQETIGLREGGDGARALAGGIGQQTIGAIHERCHDEFGASQFGGHMHRQMGGDF